MIGTILMAWKKSGWEITSDLLSCVPFQRLAL